MNALIKIYNTVNPFQVLLSSNTKYKLVQLHSYIRLENGVVNDAFGILLSCSTFPYTVLRKQLASLRQIINIYKQICFNVLCKVAKMLF